MVSGGGGRVAVIQLEEDDDDIKTHVYNSLTIDRSNHTSDGNLICGGQDSSHQSNCVTLSEDMKSLTISHNLTIPRFGHSSWPVRDGVILMGGGNYTPEFVREVFDCLKHNTIVISQNFSNLTG